MSKQVAWGRVLLEGVVIVASILLAFGIEAGWQGRQESERAGVALGNLEAALVESLSLIDEELERLELWRDRLTVFLIAEPTEVAELPRDSVAQILLAISRPVVNNLNSDELLAMLEGGALQELEDPALRVATAHWRSRWQVVLDRHESIYQMQDDALRALAEHPSTRPAVHNNSRRREIGQVGADAFVVARRDPTLVQLAHVKLQHWDVLAGMYGGLRIAAESAIDVLQGAGGR